MTSAHTSHLRRFAVAAATMAVLFALPKAASAQISALGSTLQLVVVTIRGVDVAPDPSGGYLVVGALNYVVGVCVNGSGQPTGSVMTIKPTSAAYGAFPRARYSPQANGGKGGFLVVWPEENGPSVILKARVVSCTDGPVGAEQVISGGDTLWLESGAAVAYSATSQKFFVVWKGYPNTAVKGRLVDVNAIGVGDVVTLSSGFGRDPGVVWNPSNNEFGVSFSGESGVQAYSGFARVPATNPAGFSRTTFNFVTGALTAITDIDYNPDTNRYVMSWWQYPNARVAEIDTAGNVVSDRAVSSLIGSYDALSMAFNALSKSFLLTGIDRVDDNLWGVELDGSGNRIGAEVKLNNNYAPVRYPRVAANASSTAWNISFSGSDGALPRPNPFRAITNQAVATGTVSTPGPAPVPSPTPAPTPVSSPRLNIDLPSSNGTVKGVFTIAGWALDLGASSNSGVDMVHVWAYPTSGASPVFAGSASYGVARPDVAAAFGNSIFTNSGFALDAQLSPGTYDLAVFPHSTVSGAFAPASVVRVTVEAPVSSPLMWVDTPVAGTNLSQNVTVSGWALDLGSVSGPGVDAVHVWAYPGNGGPAVLLGVANYGQSRADVGAAFASTRFNNSGFVVQGTLPPGDYTLVAFAHSSVANAFNNVFVIPVRVY